MTVRNRTLTETMYAARARARAAYEPAATLILVASWGTGVTALTMLAATAWLPLGVLVGAVCIVVAFTDPQRES